MIQVLILTLAYALWLTQVLIDVGGDVADIIVTVILPLVVGIGLMAIWQADRPASRRFALLSKALLPGVMAGIVLGIVLRIGMAVVSVMAGNAPHVTVGGVAVVLAFGIILGTPFAVLLTAIWATVDSFGRAPGLYGGVMLALWFWYPFYMTGRDDLAGVVSLPVLLLAATLMSSLWLVFGMCFTALMRRSGALGSTAHGAAAS